MIVNQPAALDSPTNAAPSSLTSHRLLSANTLGLLALMVTLRGSLLHCCHNDGNNKVAFMSLLGGNKEEGHFVLRFFGAPRVFTWSSVEGSSLQQGTQSTPHLGHGIRRSLFRQAPFRYSQNN